MFLQQNYIIYTFECDVIATLLKLDTTSDYIFSTCSRACEFPFVFDVYCRSSLLENHSCVQLIVLPMFMYMYKKFDKLIMFIIEIDCDI